MLIIVVCVEVKSHKTQGVPCTNGDVLECTCPYYINFHVTLFMKEPTN